MKDLQPKRRFGNGRSLGGVEAPDSYWENGFALACSAVSDWQAIWERRTAAGPQPSGLEDLIAHDGFNSGAGRISTQDFQLYALRVVEWLGVVDGDSVFEVGCGAGALLHAMSGHRQLHVGGCDYSEAQVSRARHVMPGGDFQAENAVDFRLDPAFDVGVSNSVFQYLDGLEEAGAVIKRLLGKSRRAIAILDVPDAEFEVESEDMRRAELSPGEYERMYADLSHLYFRREFFAARAEAEQCRYELRESFVPNYPNGKFRFSILLVKSDVPNRS